MSGKSMAVRLHLGKYYPIIACCFSSIQLLSQHSAFEYRSELFHLRVAACLRKAHNC